MTTSLQAKLKNQTEKQTKPALVMFKRNNTISRYKQIFGVNTILIK